MLGFNLSELLDPLMKFQSELLEEMRQTNAALKSQVELSKEIKDLLGEINADSKNN